MNGSVAARGSCNCGAVRFTLSAPVTDVYICHCSLCRKSTGSGGIAVTVVPREVLTWVSGEASIRNWAKPGHDWMTKFCERCGSPLPGENDQERLYVPVSLLDSGHEQLGVKHHIFVSSKAPWEVLGGEGRAHAGALDLSEPGAPGQIEALFDAYRRAWDALDGAAIAAHYLEPAWIQDGDGLCSYATRDELAAKFNANCRAFASMGYAGTACSRRQLIFSGDASATIDLGWRVELGDGPRAFRGTYMCSLRGGNWKIMGAVAYEGD